jgi:hypothetical protein
MDCTAPGDLVKGHWVLPFGDDNNDDNNNGDDDDDDHSNDNDDVHLTNYKRRVLKIYTPYKPSKEL